MTSLFQLAVQHRELAALDPEEIDEQTLTDTVEGLTGEIQIKAKSCAAYVLNCEAYAEAIEAAAAQMAKRAKSLRNKSEWLRQYMLANLKAAGVTEIKSPEFVLKIRKNPAAVHIKPEVTIPSEYMVTPEAPPPYPDKRKLADALKAGIEIDGVWLEQGVRLHIG